MSISAEIDKVEKSNLFHWDWRTFLLVAIAAIPIPVVALFDIDLALAMPLGLIPAVFSGVAPKRKSRRTVLMMGVLIPVSLVLGSLLSHYTNAWIAGIVLVLLTVLAVFMMTQSRMIGLSIIVPVVAIGLSFPEVQTVALLFVIMVAESVVAFLVSLCFPERPMPKNEQPIPRLPLNQARVFGVLYGLALFTAVMISWGWDHMGWVVGSAALVMRPVMKAQDFRSIWRAISIFFGVVIASAVLLLQPSTIVAALFSACAMVVCAGLSKSRAYIVPMFMTICIFMMIEYPVNEAGEVLQWFIRRVTEVGLGILIAWVFGLLAPFAIRFFRQRRPKKKS